MGSGLWLNIHVKFLLYGGVFYMRGYFIIGWYLVIWGICFNFVVMDTGLIKFIESFEDRDRLEYKAIKFRVSMY